LISFLVAGFFWAMSSGLPKGPLKASGNDKISLYVAWNTHKHCNCADGTWHPLARIGNWIPWQWPIWPGASSLGEIILINRISLRSATTIFVHL
jgi:hypothetical protein